jgi:hydroxymethylbilane synthase
MRRQCQLLAVRPDLQIAMLRGNVPTRVKKLDDGEFDAIILAAAGLTRLGMGDRITQLLPLELSIPACAQGVLGLETRAQDFLTAELIRRAMHDPAEERRVAAERSFLARMGGSCQTPLAAHAIDRAGGGLRVLGMCGMPDGSKILRAEVGGAAEEAELLGRRLAEDLIAQGADAILAATND